MSPGGAENAEVELGRARSALRAARLLLDAGSLDDATSRLYYAASHAARAALQVRGAYAKTHSGQITLFARLYGAEPLLGKLFDLRGAADDGTGVTKSREELALDAASTEAFVSRCEAIVADAIAKGPDEPDAPPDL